MWKVGEQGSFLDFNIKNYINYYSAAQTGADQIQKHINKKLYMLILWALRAGKYGHGRARAAVP